MKEIKLTANGKKVKAWLEDTDFNEVFEDRIKVPDNIHIHLGNAEILFNNNNQLLGSDNGLWLVWVRTSGFTWDKDLYLQECMFSDIKVGDVYYYSDDRLSNIDNPSSYAIRIIGDKYAYVNCDDSVIVSKFGYGYYYKVVR